MSKTPEKSTDDRRNGRVASGVCRYVVGISIIGFFPHIFFSSHTNSLTFYDYPSQLQHGPVRSKTRILITPGEDLVMQKFIYERVSTKINFFPGKMII